MSLKDILKNRASNSSVTAKPNPLLARKINSLDTNSQDKPKVTQSQVNDIVNKIVSENKSTTSEIDTSMLSSATIEAIDSLADNFGPPPDKKVQPESKDTSLEDAKKAFDEKNSSAKVTESNNEESSNTTNNTSAEDSPKPEEKPVTTKKRKKSEPKVENQTEVDKTPNESKVDLSGQNFDYNKTAATVLSEYIDDDWREYEKQISEKLDKIRIEPDMNPGTLKYILADLNNLYDEIAVPLTEQKKLLESLTDKDFGVATTYRIVNNVGGSNEHERDRNGILALMSAGENKINFIALIAAAKMRYTFLYSVYNRIRYKSQICITMSCAIKMEFGLLNGEEKQNADN